jgi:dsDNA-specific endonuclease/ATPase MutS2
MEDPEPIILPVEDSLDLHAFSPRDIPVAVEAYLEEAYSRGLTAVRLIHGRGIGVQRERVRSILAGTPFVARFEDAPPESGGWGATVIHFVRP